MARFLIEPHFRLQEWIAYDKGYFTAEGLDYEFRETIRSSDGKVHDKVDRQGAMQSFEAGRKADVSCASVANGTLLIFPSYLEHSVDENRSEEERISISFNVMFSSFTQNLGKPLW